MNVVVLVGRLARDAAVRALPSGVALVQLEVTVAGPEGRRESVPVVWFDAPAGAAELAAGAGVVVTGRVRRRFWRAAGTTASRTEVVADRVVPATASRRVRAALARARAAVDAADVSPAAG
jgi:single-strand DNA-binding protein